MDGDELERDAERILALRELRRILKILCGDNWEDVYQDIISYFDQGELFELEDYL